MLPLITALTVLAAVACLAVALRSQPRRAAEARMAALVGDAHHEDAEARLRTQDGRFAAVGRSVPTSVFGRLDDALASAGRPASVGGFVVAAAAAAVAIAAVLALVVIGAGGPVGAALVGAGFAAAFVGLVGSRLWLRRRTRRRQLEIWRSLPEAADLLTTCVEAGLDINASFARVALEMSGPLQQEVRIMLSEVSLGRRRRDALMDVGTRSGVEDLDGVLMAIIQAEESGTSLGGVLRAQSRHIRAARRLYAEERARLVPAKMTFPIIFFIVPTLFLLILGPLGLEVLEIFS